MQDGVRFSSHDDRGSTAENLFRMVLWLMQEPRGFNFEVLRRDLDVSRSTLHSYVRRINQILAFQGGREGGGGVVTIEPVGEGRRVVRLAWNRSEERTPGGSHHVRRVAALRLLCGAMGRLLKMDPFCVIPEIASEYQAHLRQRKELRELDLRELEQRYLAFPTPPAPRELDPELVGQLTRAIEGRHRVTLNCLLPDGPWRQTVDPLSLVMHGLDLFLVFRMEDDPTFRCISVGRVRSVQRTSRTFYRPTTIAYRPDRLCEGVFGPAEFFQRPVQFTLVFWPDPEWRQWLDRNALHPLQKRTVLDDGRIQVTFPCRCPEAVRSWVARLGNQVEVMESEPSSAQRPAGGRLPSGRRRLGPPTGTEGPQDSSGGV